MLVSVTPTPAAITDKIFNALEPMLGLIQAELKKEMGTLGDTQEDKLAKAVLEELDGKLNRKGLESLGVSTSPKFALYGLGLMPVFRIELKDPAALKAAIGRVEAKAGVKAPVKKAGDQEYYEITDDGLTVVIAIVGNELVFAATPESAGATTVPMVLGQKKPEKSIAAAGTLTKLMKDNGFAGHGAGYVDNMAIADTLLGNGTGLNGMVFTEMNKSGANIPALPPEIKDVCTTEIKTLVGNFPMMTFGTTSADAKHWVTEFTLKTNPGLAKELAGLRAAVPGLGLDHDSLFSFGLGLDIQKTLAFFKGKAGAVKANPWKCPMLADMNEGFVEMEAGLNQPMPPFVTGLKGLFVNVKSADISGPMPKDIKAVAVLSADKPGDLLTMAKGMVQPLANVDVKPGGKPALLPTQQLGVPPFIGPVHIALSEKSLAVSVGAGEEQNLAAAMSAKSPAQPPLISYGYDMGRFMGMVQAQTKAMMENMPPEMKAEQEAQMKMVQSLSGVFGVVTINITLADDGVVMQQRMNLK